MTPVKAADLLSTLAATVCPAAVAFARAGLPPSDALLESLGELAPRIRGRFEVFVVDLDEPGGGAEALARDLRIHRVPELFVYAAGGRKLLARLEGEMPADEVLDLLEVAARRA
jgi:thioredoxin-like negative regulator of GroEL